MMDGDEERRRAEFERRGCREQVSDNDAGDIVSNMEIRRIASVNFSPESSQ